MIIKVFQFKFQKDYCKYNNDTKTNFSPAHIPYMISYETDYYYEKNSWLASSINGLLDPHPFAIQQNQKNNVDINKNTTFEYIEQIFNQTFIKNQKFYTERQFSTINRKWKSFNKTIKNYRGATLFDYLYWQNEIIILHFHINHDDCIIGMTDASAAIREISKRVLQNYIDNPPRWLRKKCK